MITRYWRGVTYAEKADAYEEHLKDETFRKLETIEGFISAQILRRSVSDGTEFIILTTWESMNAIRSFAGEDTEKAVVPAKAAEMMISYDERVIHYDLTFSTKA